MSIWSTSQLLNIECAGGESLPYDGFVDVTLHTTGITSTEPISCLFLISKDTVYNTKVPALLGTNILTHLLDGCKERHGVKFLQKAALHTPWYLAFRSMVLREKELVKNGGKIGLVKNAEPGSLIIPANSQAVIRGHVIKMVNFPKVCAMVQPTEMSTVSKDLDIAPTLVDFNCDNPGLVEIHVANVTTQTIIVPSQAVICELQPITVQAILPQESADSKQLLDQVEIGTQGLTKEEVNLGIDIILKFGNIFSKSDDDLGHSTAVQHRIDLTEDIPFKQRHRRIPPAMYDEVHTHLQQLLSPGVIRPWAVLGHPTLF